jgi:hypothetical protein
MSDGKISTCVHANVCSCIIYAYLGDFMLIKPKILSGENVYFIKLLCADVNFDYCSSISNSF